MYLRKMNEKTRTVVYASIVVAMIFGGLLYGVGLNTAGAAGNEAGKAAAPVAPAATFPATGTGAIADGSGTCPTPGTPLNMSFNVTGISGPPSTVSVDVTFGSPNHTFMGDIVATLIAPNGASHTLFGATALTAATGFGDSSDLGATYSFSNAGTPTWWSTAIATGTTAVMPAGNYRTSNTGGVGQTGAATDINAAFSAIPASNGTWTLRVTDGCGGDTGAVTAANLTLTPAAVASAPIDYNGDGKTDYSVARNIGGGPSGQVAWFNCLNGLGEPACYDIRTWGLASDFFVPEDFDGDNKTDIAVWRPGAATVASFYILQSQTSTLRQEFFGQTGDDPSVVGDYNGDGKADVAVYRAGVSAGDQSTWYFRTTQAGPVTFVPWGSNGDFPAPGDYDGDGKNDFVIQRNDGGGQARFWRRYATGTTDTVNFGTPTDLVVPGDYDGDGKTDIAVTRGVGGNINWYVVPSSTGVISAAPFAVFGTSSTDFVAQGDYDGDGKTDVAIWRPNADPTLNFFYYIGSTSGVNRFEWGANGDYPLANFNSH